MISSTRFGLCLHAIISDFTGRELSHGRFSCGDPLSAGHSLIWADRKSL